MLALLGPLLLLASCVGNPEPSASSAPLTCKEARSRSGPTRQLVVSDLGIVGDAPTYIALEHGHFAAYGLDVELQRFRSAVDMIPFLGQGRLDAGTGTLSAGFYNGLAAGLEIVVVADSAQVAPGPDSHLSLVIEPTLAAEVVDYRDLGGLRLAINAPAGGLEVELARAVGLGGLTLEDVDVVNVPFHEMIGAFTMGVIDGAIIPEPFLSVGLNQGTFVEFAPVGEFYPGHQISVLMFSDTLARDKETASRFLCAYLRGVRDFRNALVERSAPPDRVIEAIMRHTPIEDVSLFEIMRYHEVDPNGLLNVNSILYDVEYYRRAGYLLSVPDSEDFIDLEMVKQASGSPIE